LRKPVPASVQRRVDRARRIVLALSAVIVTALVAIGIYYIFFVGGPDEIAEGTHYRTVGSQARGGPIRVTEFFSYGCPHCKTFEPLIAEWSAALPEDVRFERVAVSYSPDWTMLAQTYSVLARTGALEGNHTRLFAALHDDGRTFRSKDELADFVDGHGITREEFLAAFDSPTTRRTLAESNRRVRDLSITSVPSIVIADRWVILPEVSRRDTLAVADHLIEKARAERVAPAS
jgi:protein dithiol oxidoreductase (disulfide-forming)